MVVIEYLNQIALLSTRRFVASVCMTPSLYEHYMVLFILWPPQLLRRFGPCLVDEAGDVAPTRNLLPTISQVDDMSKLTGITDGDSAGHDDERVGQGQQDNEQHSVRSGGSLRALQWTSNHGTNLFRL